MLQQVQNAFDRYKQMALDSLRPRPQSAHQGVVRLVHDSTRLIRESVAALEDTEEFKALAIATRSAFHPRPSRSDHSLWVNSVGNFFRRSGFYLNAAAGKAIAENVSFTQYSSAFGATERNVTYLAPIEHVEFAKAILHLGSFQIRRFTSDELARLLEVDINRVFYQWALTDVGVLDDYWYVALKKTVERKNPGHIPINLADIDKVAPTFARFPELSEALLPLVCFPWQADLCIPFLIVVDEDILRSPRSRPAVDQLDREPVFDPATGEETDTDRPMIWTSLDKEKTSVCEEMVRSVAEGIQQLEPCAAALQFFDRAGRYLLKGFFAEGFEQLLWHITTVDALLGDDAPGAAKRLARRVAAIFGTTTTGENVIRERFRELYDFRSRFVHGAAIEKQALTNHLRDARETARGLLVWFLAFLTHTQDVVRREGLQVPPRKVLLQMIDLDSKAKSELQTTLKITETLPEGFPVVPGWLANHRVE